MAASLDMVTAVLALARSLDLLSSIKQVTVSLCKVGLLDVSSSFDPHHNWLVIPESGRSVRARSINAAAEV
jgi:hypothetical protein